MKKLVLFILGLTLIILACKALQPSTPIAITPTAFSKFESPTIPAQLATPSQTELAATSTSTVIEAITSTPRPTPKPISCTKDSCLKACLERINNAIPQNSYQPLTGAYAGDNIDLNLVHYDVKDGQLTEPDFLDVPDAFKSFQQDTVAHQNIWAYASGLLPPEEMKWIDGFEIFSSSYYAAWVRPSGFNKNDRAHWTLGMDVVDAQNPVDLTYILVHEYGHLITLNTDQIPASDYYYGWSQNPAICPRFLSPDGCTQPKSYLNLFYQKFWTKILPEWQKEVDRPHVNSPDEFRALVHDFYKGHQEQFVREYAATNIKEDIADSFMHFVLEPKPSKKDILFQKISFFYDFPELVVLRQSMIQNICSYTS